jgi:hypothetical protein
VFRGIFQTKHMSADLPRGDIDEPKRNELISRGYCPVSGWALDAATPLRAVLLTLDDRVIATVDPNLARPDIAAHFSGVPHAATCGWKVVLDLRQHLKNRAVLGITALTATGDAIPLANVDIQLQGEPEGARRTRCVFTIVQNEARYLPIWLSYYSRHFDATDIFLLDHNTTDGSTTGLGDRCHVVPVHRDTSFDHYWLKDTVESFQSFLLRSYETVLFVEADEFVVANPSRYDGLGDYIRRMPGPMARCLGFEVVHYPEEPALQFDQPLLAQRGYWHGSRAYSKTLISRIPLTWVAGFHDTLFPLSPSPDPDLILAHLHRVDFEYCRARHEAAVRRKWSEADVARGHGRQSRIFEPEQFRRWFYEDADLENAPRDRIPDVFRKEF